MYFLSKTFLILMTLFLLSAPAQVEAQETAAQKRCPFSETLENPDIAYTTKAGNTLMRGALNAGFGWTELILYPAEAAREGKGNVVTNITKAAGQGFFRTLGGFGEIFTFWTPKVGKNYILFSDDSPLDMYND